MNFLDALAKYSNIILVIITSVYAYLTWKMVSEMRTAREAQTDSDLIAGPVPLGPIYLQVQLQNAGPGPAKDVELAISLSPQHGKEVRVWRSPVMLASQTEYFLLPGDKLDALSELAKTHDQLLLEVRWKNVFNEEKANSSTHDLANLAEGWYKAGNLLQPEDIPEQLKKIREILDKVRKSLETIAHEAKH